MDKVATVNLTVKGMRSGAAIGSSVPLFGTVGGTVIGGMAGYGAKQAMDAASEAGIKLAADGIQEQFPSLTDKQAAYVAMAVMMATTGTKGMQEILTKGWNKTKAATAGFRTAATEFKTKGLNIETTTIATKQPLQSSSSSSSHKPAAKKDELKKPEIIANENSYAELGIKNSENIIVPLLPYEGKVGTYGELDRKFSVRGDNLTSHHIPQDSYMKQYGIKHADGISIMVEQPQKGPGGRHRRTDTFGKKPDYTTEPRTELAKDILDLRNIYREDGLYNTQMKEGLKQVIEKNKQHYQHIFEKKK